MSLVIKHQEVQFAETNNNVSIRTTVPKEFLDDDTLLLPHVRRMALPADTEIRVSVMNATYDVLLHTATFMVWKAVKSQKRVIDDDGRGERVVTQTGYLIGRVGEWQDSPETWQSEIQKATQESVDILRADPDVSVEPEVEQPKIELSNTAIEVVDSIMADPKPEAKRRPGRPRKTEAA